MIKVILLSIIPIIIFIWMGINLFNVCYNWQANKSRVSSYPKLSAKQFKEFVLLCPDKWNWPDYDSFAKIGYYIDPPNYGRWERNYTVIWFKNPFEMYKAWKWYNNYCKNKIRIENNTAEAIATAEFIEKMKCEINNAQNTANKMMSDSEQQLREVLKRLDENKVSQKEN